MYKKTENFSQTGIPTVVIVGRPNVGKSALFNAIIGKRVSIVHQESGVTRDNILHPVKFRNHYFQLIDTGGLGHGKLEVTKKISFFDTEIAKQVKVAIESADILLQVTDITAGITALDEEVARTIRKSGKKAILVVNKADNPKMAESASEFTKLGFDEVLCVSCLHRRGITNLIESFIRYLPEITPEEEKQRILISVIGRQNVGKSSIVNKLIGEEKAIVSNIAGTTRDVINSPFDIKIGEEILPITLIDTAGLRKQGRANTAVEIFSIMRAKEAINHSDMVILVIEAAEMGATAQDAHVGRLISDAGKGCIIIANKWDKCSGLQQKKITDEIKRTLPFLTYAPIVFTCAVSGYNFKKILTEIKEVNKQYKVKIPTSALNKVLSDIATYTSSPCIKNKFFKIYYGTMVSNKPPLFSLFVNDPKICPNHYLNYLKNSLRKAFGFKGLPIHLKLIKRKKPDENN